VERPATGKADIQPLSAEQVAALLAAAAGDRLEALYSVAVGTGLRLGELFGLQWSDVDLKAGAVTVRHTLQELNGKLTLKEPKTDKSRRRVELPDSAVAALTDHRKRMFIEGHAAVPWVFCNQHGGPLRRSHFHREDFKPLLAKAELPDIRFHDLRHTSATLLLSAGVHPKVVQERLGHSQISITMDVYSHVLPTMQREAAGRLDSILSAATKSHAASATA
jgi:integrase